MANKLLLATLAIIFVIKILSINFTSFNLFGDEAQYWLWSKNLDFGYFSKPPLLAWSIGLYTLIFSDSFVSLKLFPSVIYIITACAIYKLSNNIGTDRIGSITCSLIFLSIPAVTFSSFILSTDLFLLLFWTLSLNELVKIQRVPKFKNFILLGVFLGLGFLSKYAAIYFTICLFVYVLIDKNFRVFFFKNYIGFFLSLCCILLIVFPNIMWNFNNSWVTFSHTSDNANFDNINIDLTRGFIFLFVQILMIGPFLFLGGIIGFKKLSLNKNDKFLLIFSLPILLIVFIEAIIVRANANWAAPALISLFLFLYTYCKGGIFKKLNLFFNFSFCVIFFVLIGLSYDTNIFKRVSGLDNFAKSIYLERLDKNIVDIAVSDRLLFASMSYELKDLGLTFHMPHKNGSKITNHFKLNSALKKKMKRNFIFVGSIEEINYLENNFNLRKRRVPQYKFTDKDIYIYEIYFN
tara:strand:+ start:584 stop:1975 length:1392 start_codon:yes stop_codon:yes gene_type:complete